MNRRIFSFLSSDLFSSTVVFVCSSLLSGSFLLRIREFSRLVLQEFYSRLRIVLFLNFFEERILRKLTEIRTSSFDKYFFFLQIRRIETLFERRILRFKFRNTDSLYLHESFILGSLLRKSVFIAWILFSIPFESWILLCKSVGTDLSRTNRDLGS